MKRQIALILSALLCILSACGGMGTDAPELDLPEADVIESDLSPPWANTASP